MPTRLVGIFDRLAKYSGLLRWLRWRSSSGVTILMYHKVLPRQAASRYPMRNLVVDTDSFDQQIAWLADHFDVLPVRQAMERLDGGRAESGRTERPLACVTFDDGYQDNFNHAAPILESHGLRGTFYVATDFVCGTAFWFDLAAAAWESDSANTLRQAVIAVPELREQLSGVSTLDAWLSILKRVRPELRDLALAGLSKSIVSDREIYGAMTSDQICKLSRRGHEIGAHSVTHAILTQLDDAALRIELDQSRSTLFEWTGVRIDGVCYPNGNYDDRVVAAARTAGYRYGCAVTRGVATGQDERLALPRRAILSRDRSMAMLHFEAEVVGWHDRLRDWHKS
jgi:peptidoglycan/xylan/chitin deacetylase (PgdA/CDA1 family)